METVGVWWNFIHSAHESRGEKSGPGEILKLRGGGGGGTPIGHLGRREEREPDSILA